jgi:hypothetical protein
MIVAFEEKELTCWNSNKGSDVVKELMWNFDEKHFIMTKQRWRSPISKSKQLQHHLINLWFVYDNNFPSKFVDPHQTCFIEFSYSLHV